MKTSILSVIEEAVTKGVRQHRACELVQIDVRRVQRWQTRDGRLDDIVPGSIFWGMNRGAMPMSELFVHSGFITVKVTLLTEDVISSFGRTRYFASPA